MRLLDDKEVKPGSFKGDRKWFKTSQKSVNDFLNAKSMLKRAGFRAAWSIVLPLAVRDAGVRERIDALKDELTGDPERLKAMAALVRKEGPRIVREAYQRAEE